MKLFKEILRVLFHKKDVKEQEIIYISINNWFAGRDFPESGFFYKKYDKNCDGWINLFSDEYCKRNKLCVNYTVVDMSQNFCISAPKKWVMKNCPEILENESFKKKFTYPEPGVDRLDCMILDYCEENIGLTYSEDPDQVDIEDEGNI